MKMILERTWKYNEKTYLAFFDLEKAFDRVPRHKLWQPMKKAEYEIPPELLRALEQYKEFILNEECCVDSKCSWGVVQRENWGATKLCPITLALYSTHGPRSEASDGTG